MKICYFGTYDRTYSSNRLILQGLRENNVPVVEINAHTKVTELNSAAHMSWGQILKRIFGKYRIISEFAKNYNEFKKTDVIYVGYPGHVDLFAAYVIAKLFGKKLVFNPLLIVYVGFSEEQGILSKNSLLGKTIKIAEGLGYKLCDMVFADTPNQAEFLKKNFGVKDEKLRVLPIGADNKGYEYSVYKNKNGKKVNVVYYGLYAPMHGVEFIVETANLLKNDNDIVFSMVGSGNKYQETYNKAQELGLKNIKFYPDVFEGQHLKYLQDADIFLGFLKKHPTIEKVIPNKVYQGLALGRAVITADSPVIRSVFKDHENMYFVEPSNARVLADAILDLKNNPELRSKIAKNGYELYINNFTPKHVGAKLKKYIEEVL